MRFSWSGSKFLLNQLVNGDCVGNNSLFHRWNFPRIRRGCIFKEEPFHHIVENVIHAFFGVWLDVDDIEVSYIARRNRISAASWWSHCSCKLYILYNSEFFLRSIDVIPTTVIHPLSKKLNWRLIAPFLFHGHVQIIHKDKAFLTHWGSIDTFPSLFHLAIYDSLCLVWTGLGRKRHVKITPLIVVKTFLKLINNSDTFASTCGPAEEWIFSIQDEHHHKFIHPDRIDSGYNNLCIRTISWHYIWWECLEPVNPWHLFSIEVKVKETLKLS